MGFWCPVTSRHCPEGSYTAPCSVSRYVRNWLWHFCTGTELSGEISKPPVKYSGFSALPCYTCNLASFWPVCAPFEAGAGLYVSAGPSLVARMSMPFSGAQETGLEGDARVEFWWCSGRHCWAFSLQQVHGWAPLSEDCFSHIQNKLLLKQQLSYCLGTVI